MNDQQRQYRHLSPSGEFWVALEHVRNYLLQDPAFSCFVCLHRLHEDPLATDFWIVDTWLHAAQVQPEELGSGSD